MLTMRDVREIKKVIREPYYSIRRDKISELCEIIERQNTYIKELLLAIETRDEIKCRAAIDALRDVLLKEDSE